MKFLKYLVVGLGVALAITVAEASYTGTGPLSVLTTSNTRTFVPLDIATVTTGGTAVNALSAGHRSAGGWLDTEPAHGYCEPVHQ